LNTTHVFSPNPPSLLYRNGKGHRTFYASDCVVPPIIVVKEGFEYAGGKGYIQEECVLVSLPGLGFRV
jgi:hypothetical protein